MRYGIFSDVHANLEALDAVINAYRFEAIDKYLCVGDLVGYATNPNECVEKVKALAMITIAGNHDWASVDKFSLEYFTSYAKEALLWTRPNLTQESRSFLENLRLTYKNEDLTLVHGTLDKPQEFNYLTDGYLAEESFKLLETRICFVGHTHKPGTFIHSRPQNRSLQAADGAWPPSISLRETAGFSPRSFIQEEYGCISYTQENPLKIRDEFKYIINVGSVGQPRDRNPQAAYCIYDTDKKEVQIRRVGYDIEATRKKIIAAGLPRFLGDRLLIGR